MYIKIGVVMLAISLTGCVRSSLQDIVQALNDRQISHCIFGQFTVAPYGHVTLFGKTGDLDCERLWKRLTGPTL